MSVFWPRGLAGRVALLLTLSLIAIQVVSIPYYLNQQARTATEVFEHSTSARIAHITRTFDTLNNERRRLLLPMLNSPSLAVELFYQLPALQGEVGVEQQQLVVELAETLRRPLHVLAIDAADTVGEETTLLRGLFASQELIAIWAPLEDGTWLRFVTASALPSLGWIMHLSAQIILTSLAIILFAGWAARQLTRPIRTFAAAAQRLGRDVNAAPIEERGSRELRRATRVFNTMQDNLQRYVAGRTRMLAAISHDLRTSLTRLRLRAAFIEDKEQQRKAEQDIEDMDSMLSATLAFARDDAADEPRVKVDLAAMLHSLCDDLGDSGKAIRYEGPGCYNYLCRAVSLQRALANVMSNAASYGEQAEVCLVISAHQAIIEVSDNGPGIPEADMERVFEPFVRLDSARSRSSGGTGLGLPIARSVIHAHGGSLILSNRPGGGLLVRIELPL